MNRYVKAEEDLRSLCNQILEFHDPIRFVGVYNKTDKQIMSNTEMT
jgi:hypothetical protein